MNGKTCMKRRKHVSGAPFNPATTFGFALVRRFPWRYLLPYWIAQVGGGSPLDIISGHVYFVTDCPLSISV